MPQSGLTYGGASSSAGGTYGGIDGGGYGQPELRDIIDRSIAVGRSRADGFDIPMPEFAIGETVSITLRFLNPDYGGGFPNHYKRYQQLRERLFYGVNSVTTGLMQDGSPWFLERHNRESVVVKVEPGVDTTVPSVWGIITDFTDDTSLPEEMCVLEVDVFVLGKLDEYDDRRAVKNALERE